MSNPTRASRARDGLTMGEHVVVSVGMREEWWQPLVSRALCEQLGCRLEYLHSEVQTRDGSIIDLVHLNQRKITGFELKMADAGEVSLGLNARAVRQLRHFRAACDQLYLVTVSAPRAFELGLGGSVLVREPPEAQLLPEGVGWAVFDRLSFDLTVVRPPGSPAVVEADRRHLVDTVLARLGRATTAAKRCRV